jgi:hypothetical protein
MGEINGIIGASIWIVAKPRLVYDWEALYAALLIAVACCCYRLYIDKQPQERRTLAWLLGVSYGFYDPHAADGDAAVRCLAGLGDVASQRRVLHQEFPRAAGPAADRDYRPLDDPELSALPPSYVT